MKINKIAKKMSKKINEGYRIEALDRVDGVCEMFDSRIVNHIVFTKHPELKKKAEKIARELGKLYQEVGKI